MKTPHVRTELPGPRARALLERDRPVTSPSYPRDDPFVMSHGRGVEVWDVDGNRFLDFAAGIRGIPSDHGEGCHPGCQPAAERKAIPMIRHDAESQVNFPSGYLDSPDRLELARMARPGSIEAVITARDRPTSLARFAPGQTPETTRGQGITVMVKKGRSRHMCKAFMVRLKNGNLGVAIRLKQGEKPDRAYKPVLLANNVYLLYGPSVDQVVRTVAEESLPAIGDLLTNEFFRQFARLSHD